jgi:hypothetical protein
MDTGKERIMNKILGGVVLISTLLLAPVESHATVITFDFTNLNGGAEGILPNTVTDGGVKASGFNNNLSTTAALWLRNTTNDHGLGVCSEGEAACAQNVGGGDVNELDNMNSNEIIVLENTNGGSWTSLFVSSLDNNEGSASAGLENGTVSWSNLADFSVVLGSFGFTNGDFGASVEGNILGLPAAVGFDPTAKFLSFVAGPGGTNNDYLVWKGTVTTASVPEPTTLGVLGVGLLALGVMRRRRRHA